MGLFSTPRRTIFKKLSDSVKNKLNTQYECEINDLKKTYYNKQSDNKKITKKYVKKSKHYISAVKDILKDICYKLNTSSYGKMIEDIILLSNAKTTCDMWREILYKIKEWQKN